MPGQNRKKQDVFRVTSAEQLRALQSPARVRLMETLLDLDQATAGDLADKSGMTRGAAHHHLKVMEHIGLVSRCGERPGTRRPETLYRLAARDIVVDRSASDPAMRQEMARGARLMLQRAQRDVESRLLKGGDNRETLRLTRDMARLRKRDLLQLRSMLDKVDQFLRDRDLPNGQGIRISLTIAMSEVECGRGQACSRA